MSKEETLGNCNIEYQQETAGINPIEFGGTKEELITTVRTLRKNNDYESRIRIKEIEELKSQLDIANKNILEARAMEDKLNQTIEGLEEDLKNASDECDIANKKLDKTEEKQNQLSEKIEKYLNSEDFKKNFESRYNEIFVREDILSIIGGE